MDNKGIFFGTNEIKHLKTAGVFTSSKSRGQNFLVDANIPKKIAEHSGINSSNVAFEVGAGFGALTAELTGLAAHVVAVELDRRLASILRDMFADVSNISVHEGDILKVDINKMLEELLPKSFAQCEVHVCANLPYNITTPAISTLVEADVFKSLTIMVQKEVAERLVARPGTSDYGAFSVFSGYHTVPEILFDVSPECFYPRPNVTSSVLRMAIREKKFLSGEREKFFFRVVRAAFSQRRKTLVNALYSAFGSTYSKEDISGAVCKLGLGEKVRGEMLGIDEWLQLCNYLLMILDNGQ
ncbi:MAG: 16S rRNA (adenine(1518)-N(6)/adenine(1519)-N(6))-dimethyltransferase RsmA [Oscillospiraceae bacterium]|nr:16S rRNA (adenine(1518)-N(6)/adenine(1519)-N(6))-dimethyltransferase RsmA [Oscillospiraceae bacterium]MCL2278409.1 16S rRNA (adenine(1518)-N(6)/adenine(1519)-N(6))-dimethyltransferase RsmA [Oscillospiraceae bacterium]